IEDGSNTRLFRLQVLAENGIEWKMDIDERQIERLDDTLDHSDSDDFAGFSDSLDASASSEGLDALDLEEFPLTLEF
ncbi:MAG: hypothetical protein K2L34_16035, partial [Muribaculaceae bacterium]|nr:hypothetical protein [Muribaculaceae bacterium]